MSRLLPVNPRWINKPGFSIVLFYQALNKTIQYLLKALYNCVAKECLSTSMYEYRHCMNSTQFVRAFIVATQFMNNLIGSVLLTKKCSDRMS